MDTNALIDCLPNLGGAVLDVFEEEPLTTDSPLWDMPNVLITPHVAADTPMYMTRAFRLIGKNLPLFQQGEPLISEVDVINRY